MCRGKLFIINFEGLKWVEIWTMKGLGFRVFYIYITKT
jgi:hypothetical protein